MLKATGEGVNGKYLAIGLSHKNLDMLRRRMPILIGKAESGLDVDIMIFSEVDEHAMLDLLKDKIGPDTSVIIDPKLKQS